MSTASSRFVHGTGCGMAGKGEGFEVLKRTQWGYAGQSQHRRRCSWSGSAARCSRSRRMKEDYGIVESDTFRTMTIQETGGTRKTIEAGVERDQEHAAARQRVRARDAAGVAS